MNNPNIKIEKTELLSANWYKLKKVSFKIKSKNGEWLSQSRECYDRGNGATILLYNTEKRTVILTSQFRMPTYINGKLKEKQKRKRAIRSANPKSFSNCI